MTQDDIETVMDVFTPDGTYSAFGATYTLADFPALVEAAPKGLFLTGTPVLDLDGDIGDRDTRRCASWTRLTHEMRIGWYTDTYRRTDERVAAADPGHDLPPQSGARDSGRPHDPTRPEPSAGSPD